MLRNREIQLFGELYQRSNSRNATTYVWNSGVGPNRVIYGRYATAQDRAIRAVEAFHRLTDEARQRCAEGIRSIPLIGRKILSASDNNEQFALYQGFRVADTAMGGLGSPEEIEFQARSAIATLAMERPRNSPNAAPTHAWLFENEHIRETLAQLTTVFLLSLDYGTSRDAMNSSAATMGRRLAPNPTYEEFREELTLLHLTKGAKPPSPTDPNIAAEAIANNNSRGYKNASLWRWLTDYLVRVVESINRAHVGLTGMEVGLALVDAASNGRREIHPSVSNNRVYQSLKENITVRLGWLANDAYDDETLPDIGRYVNVVSTETLNLLTSFEEAINDPEFPIKTLKNDTYCKDLVGASQDVILPTKDGGNPMKLVASTYFPKIAMPVGSGTRHVVSRLGFPSGERYLRKQATSAALERIQAETLNFFDLDRWMETSTVMNKKFTDGFSFTCVGLSPMDVVHVAVMLSRSYAIAGEDYNDPWGSTPPTHGKEVIFEFGLHPYVPEGTMVLFQNNDSPHEAGGTTGLVYAREPLLVLMFADASQLTEGGGKGLQINAAVLENDITQWNGTMFPLNSVDMTTLNPSRDELYSVPVEIHHHADPVEQEEPQLVGGNYALVRLLMASNPRTAMHVIFDEATHAYLTMAATLNLLLWSRIHTWRGNLVGVEAREYWSTLVSEARQVRLASESLGRACGVGLVYDWDHMGDILTMIEAWIETIHVAFALVMAPAHTAVLHWMRFMQYYTQSCGIGSEVNIDALAKDIQKEL